MVPDIIWSHPSKTLEAHTLGVLEKYLKNSSLPIGKVAVLFHDLGKFNPNFQKKVFGNPAYGYSHHSYLSALAFMNFLMKNEALTRDILGSNDKIDFKNKVQQILAIIAHHHGNLPDFDSLLSLDEMDSALRFLNENHFEWSNFLAEKLNLEHSSFCLDFNKTCLLTKFEDKNWKPNALVNFMDTQFVFSSVIEADKRDAANNDAYDFWTNLCSFQKNFWEKLNSKFIEIDGFSEASALNKCRTEIRKEATAKVEENYELGKRVFSLPAPTGAGKTFTLLSVAKKLQELDGNLGIIYALPFLSITDQVQEILEGLGIECLPISSKSENEKLQKAQEDYENNPTPENLDTLLKQSFSEDTFDHPFILTTFVQFFESLVSNKNSTLLKLPNFKNRIFLIDEIQALPPRLYTFFAAWLDEFCRRHNSYAVLSTGTMPKFTLPDKIYPPEKSDKNPRLLFKNYNSECITEIISPEKYFNQEVFNRYWVKWLNEERTSFEELITHICSQQSSCLIILNTIADTKFLYNELKHKFPNVILLNTHFVVQDRIEKIDLVKRFLKNNEQVMVISTQLIEAGVDVDFPVVYRDLCPLPSLIQSAGRCNRNKKQQYGAVFFFHLINREGKSSAEMIYRKEAKDFLRFCKDEINGKVFEKELFYIQSKFFEQIKNDLTVGEFTYQIDRYGNESTYNFIECINKAEFAKAGKFKLIVESRFGESYQYFIPENDMDKRYEELVLLMKESLKAESIQQRLYYKSRIESALKKISGRLLTVRIRKEQTAPQYSNPEEYFGIRVLSDLSRYSKETGIELGYENCIL
ncbi:CRISPR-associated helicase, Cas3 family [Cruoricaptor ignavus]|uniref:CRISPR-associated helicase, Cas3 family n=1 Tax=Cruoricaptor ignavus TaxID=1118202 RepID=A0A1M6DK85_9FLAO|nr:CRISPR-associated helicase/endonuclease Cas3 [Cruoricaptor ignavus]SHI73767.1 CRISPR-associated helicase, Cas3 family [Cruoricaptor ignavus]